jgi:prepilin-type N-terminal cleavage/methylation domain-containing protein
MASNRGFTILEMLIVIVIMSTLAATYAPRLIEAKHRQALATEAGKSATMIIDAAKLFHFNDPEGDGHDWPTDIAELQAHNYISNGWAASHAFGGSFTLSTSGPNLKLNISSLPTDVQNIVRSMVPGFTYNAGNSTGSSSVPPPGAEPSLANKVEKAGDSMWGHLIMAPDPGSGVQSNVVINDGTNDRVKLGKDGANYGLFAMNGNGNLNLGADASMSGGAVIMRGKQAQFRDGAGGVIWKVDDQGAMTLSGATSTMTAKEVKLKNLNSNVSLSENNAWVVYTGLHRDGDDLNLNTVGGPLGGSWDNAAYYIYLTPTIFQGTDTLGGSAYPITAVRAWADPVGAVPIRRWTINIKVQNSSGGLSAPGSEQWALALVVAKINP